MAKAIQRVIKSCKHGLTGLTRFSGRDNPGRFWPYAACVVAGTMTADAAVLGIGFALAAANPRAPAAIFPSQVVTAAKIMMIVPAGAVLALAATVVRRLHDAKRSGVWGLTPLPFLALGLWSVWALIGTFGQGDPDMSLFLLALVNALLYLAALALLIILLAGKGTAGPNRFGPQPGP